MGIVQLPWPLVTHHLSVGSQGGPQEGSEPPWFIGRVSPWNPRLAWQCVFRYLEMRQWSQGLNHPRATSLGVSVRFLTWGQRSGLLCWHYTSVWREQGFCRWKVRWMGVKAAWELSPQGLGRVGFPVPSMLLHPFCELLFMNTPRAKRSLIEQVSVGERPVWSSSESPWGRRLHLYTSASCPAGFSLRRLHSGVQPSLPSFPFPFLKRKSVDFIGSEFVTKLPKAYHKHFPYEPKWKEEHNEQKEHHNMVHILNQFKKKWIISIYHSTLQIFQQLPTTPFSQTASMPCYSVWMK